MEREGRRPEAMWWPELGTVRRGADFLLLGLAMAMGKEGR
jgi:hypothetical protein